MTFGNGCFRTGKFRTPICAWGFRKLHVLRQGMPAAGLLVLTSLFAAGAAAQRRPITTAGGYHSGRGLRVLAKLEATKTLALELGLPLRSSDDLKKTLQEVYDPYNANYRHFLTPEEFDQRFAPSREDVDRVISFARSSGFEVLGTAGGGMVVRVQATVATIEKALKVQINLYQHPTERRVFFAPDVEPTIPAGVPIEHITGLDNYSIPHSLTVPQCGGAPALTAPPAGSYWGKSFRQAYAADAFELGIGQTVGIIAYDGFYQADITEYERMAGLPAVPIQTVLIDGASGSPSCDNCEISLDMEDAISMAPGISQLTVYEGGSDLDVLLEIAKPTQKEPLPNQVSTSYSMTYSPSIYEALDRIAVQGQAFFAASGDGGAYAAGISEPFAPVDFPTVTAVGGTDLTVDAAGHWVSEDGWYGSGGGVSPWGPADPNFDLPLYQVGIANVQNRASTTVRNVPDVAMTASNVAVLSGNGVWSLVGGTSAASPLWAGFMALVNQQAMNVLHGPIGLPNGPIYAVGKGPKYASVFHDITTGNNSNTADVNEYAAVTGYDLVTGWGTPRGQATIDGLVNISIPPANCPDLQKAIAFTQSQLNTAVNNLTSIQCKGPPSFECHQTIKNLQQTLTEEEALYHQECSKP